MKYLFSIVFAFFLLNCKTNKAEKKSVEFIVNKSMEVSGSEKVGESKIEFNFRDITYKAQRSDGEFSLIRMQSKGKDWIVDSLSNTGFIRSINYETVEVPDSMKVKYTASVNSVHYFSVLPYGLNDRAVNKTRLEDVVIKDKPYHTIKVTFNQDGGGEDYEDVFLYWINADTFKVDYLAYSYNEEDGKGMRFREAYNERIIEGIRFVDYNNYRPNKESITLNELPELFESGQLNLLSKIELENVKVNQF